MLSSGMNLRQEKYSESFINLPSDEMSPRNIRREIEDDVVFPPAPESSQLFAGCFFFENANYYLL